MRKTLVLLLIAVCLGVGGVEAAAPPADAPDTAPQRLQPQERCPPPTGSRISRAPRTSGACEPAPAGLRRYSREALEETGEIDLNRALTTLDPSIGRSGSVAPSLR